MRNIDRKVQQKTLIDRSCIDCSAEAYLLIALASDGERGLAALMALWTFTCRWPLLEWPLPLLLLLGVVQFRVAGGERARFSVIDLSYGEDEQEA